MGQGEGVLLTSSPCDGFGLGAAEIESSWTYAEPQRSSAAEAPRGPKSRILRCGAAGCRSTTRAAGAGVGLPSYGFSPLNEGGASAGAEPQA